MTCILQFAVACLGICGEQCQQTRNSDVKMDHLAASRHSTGDDEYAPRASGDERPRHSAITARSRLDCYERVHSGGCRAGRDKPSIHTSGSNEAWDGLMGNGNVMKPVCLARRFGSFGKIIIGSEAGKTACITSPRSEWYITTSLRHERMSISCHLHRGFQCFTPVI